MCDLGTERLFGDVIPGLSSWLTSMYLERKWQECAMSNRGSVRLSVKSTSSEPRDADRDQAYTPHLRGQPASRTDIPTSGFLICLLHWSSRAQPGVGQPQSGGHLQLLLRMLQSFQPCWAEGLVYPCPEPGVSGCPAPLLWHSMPFPPLWCARTGRGKGILPCCPEDPLKTG